MSLGVENSHMPTTIMFTEAEYLALNHLFAGGDISSSSKKELERFSVMLSRPNAFTHFGAASFPQICETVRTLLIVRMSEEQNQQAKRESRLALIISCIALLMATIQAIVGLWPLVRPSPIQVEASKGLPIYAPEPLAVRPVAQSPAQPVSSAQTPASSAPNTQRSTPTAPQSSAASSGVSK